MWVLLSFKNKMKKSFLLWTRSCPPSLPLPAVLLGSPAGITHLGCDTGWCHAPGRALLPLWHLIVFNVVSELFVDVGTSVLWQLIPFTLHASDVVSAHTDRLMLLSYSTLHMPGCRECRSIWIKLDHLCNLGIEGDAKLELVGVSDLWSSFMTLFPI